MGSEKEFYKRLKEELNNTTTWPSSYLYKFIVPTDTDKISQIEDIFDNRGAVISSKKSSNGKYTSISVQLIMQSADDVIEKYREVGKVEGVISL
ncbi:DUF493 family protein [Sinomicrobium weinanense]|uniref:DUF493 domain-containing protein n=1 Tax=Sinomicrobium weinanense TaxID=2842200 RepID=A0A926JS06_9FLAO|nr:DUF493 family protein [Sinomicrobium weinanense]MBC9796244.1 DUF493 domain-containing protein [Sinomicrobium weinanense]MBU3122301.1 DUF493 domain-containing protein [Sinomicrobium weinanense]